MKALNEMTLEELWQLFPIELVPHNPLWEQWAAEESAALSDILADFQPLINHIGSTAIPGIIAKPIVDILVEIPHDTDFGTLKRVMESAGYICMNVLTDWMSFNKGYSPEGYAERTFHIHFHFIGDRDEILFRDYLIENNEAAAEYERLKRSLLPRFRHDRDAYTEAKTDFVRRIVNLAGEL